MPLCECISQSYKQVGSDPPSVARSHIDAVTMAPFSGVCVEDIFTMEYAMSVHLVVRLGHLRLLLRVCANEVNTRLVKVVKEYTDHHAPAISPILPKVT